MKVFPLISGTTGLNTVDNPRRIKPEELSATVNITIDHSGQPQRRKGQELIQTGVFHSLFADTNCFVVKDGIIYQVGTDFSLAEIKSGLSNNRMAWCSAAGRYFYTNGIDFGTIQNGIWTEWVKTQYIGPETDKELVGPFAGNHLAFHGGRIFISKDNALFWSEQHSHGLFHLLGSFVQFNTKIRMIKPVINGMYISTEKRVHFLEGINPGAFKPHVVCTFPALEWSDCQQLIEGMEIGLQSPGLCVLWNSPEGAIVGTPTGSAINITKQKIIYPENVSQGFSVLHGYNLIHRSF